MMVYSVVARYAAFMTSVLFVCFPCSPGGLPVRAFDLATYNATEEIAIKPCQDGLWTVDLGATSSDQCRE
jgi:hypothetical protein